MIAGLIATACTSTPGTTTATPAGDAIDKNGEITTNTGAEPDTIDPQKESFVNEVAQTMMVYEALMAFDPKTLKPIPGAAKANPTLSSDGLTYTYTLRDGLTYSDGTAVTAKDFAYGFTRLCDPNIAGEYAFTGYIIAGCEAWNTMDTKKATAAELSAAKAKLGIKVNGDKEIAFTLTEKAPYFNSIAALWVGVPTRESDVTKGGDKWTEPATYIGNGPFKLTEWKHNEKLVFERNDNYRKKIQIKKVTKVMINEAAVSFAAYRNNELDMIGVSPTTLRTVEGDAELKAQMTDVGGSCSYYWGFNVRRPPFDDVNIRMAFAKGFDRAAYVKDVEQGIGKIADGGFIPPGFPGYDNTDSEQKYDVAGAKALLDKAGAASKAGLTGVKLTFSSNATNKARAEWVQSQWKTNLGVSIELDPVQSTAYSALFKKGQDSPQLFFLGWCADFPDAQNWHSTVWATGGISAARTGYSSKTFDDKTKAADKEADSAKRDALYLESGKLLSKDAPASWIFYEAGKRLTKPWIKCIIDNPIDYGIPGYFSLESGYVAKH